RLVFEASRERRVLLGIAPHLVHPLPFLFPVYRGARIPAWKLRAGMWLYDLLAAFHNVKMHRWLGRKATQRLEPGLRDKELKGAALYYDAQTDDARLVIATMRSAAHAGALVANYAEVTALIKPDGRVGGATVRDELTGRTSTVRALVVVNATGPWVDRVRRLDDAGSDLLLRPTKGVHVAVPRKRVGPAPLAPPAAAGGAAGALTRPPPGREPERPVAHRRRQAPHVPRHGPRRSGPSRGPPAPAGWPAPRSPRADGPAAPPGRRDGRSGRTRQDGDGAGGVGADGPPPRGCLRQRISRSSQPGGPRPGAGATHRRRAGDPVGRGGA